LLHAARGKSSAWFGFGLFLLSIGLLTRAGPFFVLPALLIWSAFAFAENRIVVIRPIVAGLCGIAAAWLVLKMITYAYMPPGVGANANFAYVFYGLAKGGQSWDVFLRDLQDEGGIYPGISEADVARMAYARALDLILADPRPLLRGMWGFERNYFRELGMYLQPTARGALLFLAALGVLSSVFRRAAPAARLSVAALAGILASASIIYWSSDAYRSFAATIAIDALLVAGGVSAAARFVRAAVWPAGAAAAQFGTLGSPVFIRVAGAFGVFLVAFALSGPALFRQDAVPADAEQALTCADDQRRAIVHLGRSSPYIRLTSARDAFAPEVSYERFHRDPNFGSVEIAGFLQTLRVGDMLIFGIDLAHEADRTLPIWLHMSEAGALVDGRLYVVCADEKTITVPTFAMPIYDITAFREIGPGR
jgi:hypothetical protein